MRTFVLKSFLLLLYLCFFQLPICGIDLNFKYYKVEDGLSSNTVYAIIQDAKGYIWVGTEDGLNRFDGYHFQFYRNTPRDTTTIINNYVYSLYEDIHGQLWAGTEIGISLYDHKRNAFNRFSKKTKDNIDVNDRIQNIFSDDKGNIWISSLRQGVFLYNENNTLKLYSFDKYVDNKQEPVSTTCIYKDKDNTIWALTLNTIYTLYKYDAHADEFIPAFPQTDRELLKKLKSYCMLEDNFGTLWLGSWNDGLFEVDKTTGVKNNYLNPENQGGLTHIHSMTEYEPGKLLIGSNGGLTSFRVSPVMGNRLESHIIEPILSSRFVYPIYKDREGGLWIGTYYGGINYSSPNWNYFSTYKHDPYENSISGNVVSTFCEDHSGNLWIGTDDEGLNFFNTKTERFKVYKPDKNKNSLSYHNVHALCLDNDKLWIGTYSGGLNVMDLATEKFTCYYSDPLDTNALNSNNINSLFKDSRGNIWIGTTSGINLYDREKDNFRCVKNIDAVIPDIIQVGNSIWAASIGGGIHVYDLDTEQWKNYLFDPNEPFSLISNDVICMCQDESGCLWIGTNSGLCRFDVNTQSFIQEPVNFPSNMICSIFSDNGSLWIATTKGLVYYDPRFHQYRTFTKDDGLLSEQFTAKAGIKTSSGRIYLGTTNGFNAFYSRQIETNSYIPQIQITGFQLFNESLNIHDHISHDHRSDTQQIVLPYNQNGFSFEYASLSFFAPEKNEYAYMLQGFDKSWNFVGKERKATYTNIPPGEYFFKVKGSNNDLIWNQNGLSIKLVITPPFWWNKWSISFYILLLIALIVGLITYFRRKDQEKNRIRIEKIKNEQEKEAYNSKINFFTMITHEIRTPVSLIKGPLEQIIQTSHLLPENLKQDLKIIDRNTQRLLDLINQILDFRKIEKETVFVSFSDQNVYEFLLNIYDRFKSFVEHKQIKFVYVYDSQTFHTGIDVENLTKVVSNLLNNASKFTNDYIELSLRTNTEEGKFEISVKDNGPGIEASEQETIFKPFYQTSKGHKSGTGLGLYLVKSIVDAWKGKIELKSEPGSGSTFLVTLPINDNFLFSGGKEITPVEINNEPTETDDDDSGFVQEDEKAVILIVEDNSDMQEFVMRNLLTNYMVLVAGDGFEGLKLLEKEKVDLIISDIMMPNMDGIEFCQKVKSNLLWNHIPFIMLTAKTTISSKVEALDIGADAYIEKPFSISYLLARVRNLLQSRRNLMKRFSETPFVSLQSIAGNKTDEEFLSKVNDIIEKNIDNVDFAMEDLAEELHISSSGLFAKIKNLTGITPNKLLLTVRLKKASELLAENRYRVNEVCYKVGFNNPSYFAKCFQKQYHILPKDFKEEYQKTKIQKPDFFEK